MRLWSVLLFGLAACGSGPPEDLSPYCPYGVARWGGTYVKISDSRGVFCQNAPPRRKLTRVLKPAPEKAIQHFDSHPPGSRRVDDE